MKKEMLCCETIALRDIKNDFPNHGKSFFLCQIVDELQNVLGVAAVEPTESAAQPRGLLRCGEGGIKKLLRRNFEIFADVQKTGHRRKRAAIFDFIDVTFALAERKAHIPRGNAFLHPKLCEPFGEPFQIVHPVTYLCHIV